MNTAVEKLKKALENSGLERPPRILYNCDPDPEKQKDYNDKRRVFNRNFDFMPLAIVLCETDRDVSAVVKFVNDNTDKEGKQYTLRVRSGGHDHEGECSATGVILIDLVGMTSVNIEEQEKRVRIEPGITFQELTSQLADKDVMIPHGTCQSVAIAGFTMGGGWGPWTRKYGMCCESLVAATIVLGNGDIVKLRSSEYAVVNDEDKKYTLDDGKGLLWAIKGGGGFSYGIVTEFVIKTFPLPDEIIKFEVHWNDFISFAPAAVRTGSKKMEILSHIDITTDANKKETRVLALDNSIPTLGILQSWEKAILSREPDNKSLVGTNIKIIARPAEGTFNVATAVNNCIMYGYWEGSEDDLRVYVKKYFHTGTLDEKSIEKAGKKYKVREVLKNGEKTTEKINYGDNLMSEWDRFSFHNISRILQGLEATPFPPDKDLPGPHKISSRLVNAEGLKLEGETNLLESLFSPLILKENLAMGLSTYITLGAITGNYYSNTKDLGKCSFPFRDKQFTIQYQTWWEEPTGDPKKHDPKNRVNDNVNRALDWMQVCRDYKIANTSGSFISFKDSSIPTKTYFAQSYTDLVQVKVEKSKDDFNHFRSRKTII